jgi:hypothetical protein
MAYSLQPFPGPSPRPSIQGRGLHADTPMRYYLAAMRMMVMVVVMVVW